MQRINMALSFWDKYSGMHPVLIILGQVRPMRLLWAHVPSFLWEQSSGKDSYQGMGDMQKMAGKMIARHNRDIT